MMMMIFSRKEFDSQKKKKSEKKMITSGFQSSNVSYGQVSAVIGEANGSFIYFLQVSEDGECLVETQLYLLGLETMTYAFSLKFVFVGWNSFYH